MWQILQKHNRAEKRLASLRKEEKLTLLPHPESLSIDLALFFLKQHFSARHYYTFNKRAEH